MAAAQRRLVDEMGITLQLTEVGTFRYRAEDPVSGLVENEYDHVFVGTFTGSPLPEGQVVSDWAWADIATLHQRLTTEPTSYTPWLPVVLDIATEVESRCRSRGGGTQDPAAGVYHEGDPRQTRGRF